jgi:hypothetical protein
MLHNMVAKKVPAKKVATKKPVSGVDKNRPKNNPVTPAKKPSGDRPGPWDNIGRGLKTAGKVTYEVSGAGDVKRFVKNPNLKTGASLVITAASYAAGPAALGFKATKVANAAKAINAAAPSRAAAAASKAANTTRVVKATKGAGTVTTKSGKALPMTGIKSFSTAKSPARASASSYSMSSRKAAQAGKNAGAKAQNKVVAGFGVGGAIALNKGGTTISTQNQKSKKKK